MKVGPLSEISALALTPDKSILIAGTLSPVARLLFWDLNTKLLLYSLELSDCCLVQIIKISKSGGKLVVLGLTYKRFQKIYYVDCKRHPPVILTSFPFTFSNSKLTIWLIFRYNRRNRIFPGFRRSVH
jgi:hypothetical protein